MRLPSLRRFLFALTLLPMLTACDESDPGLQTRVAALEAQIATLQAENAALVTKTIRFSDIQGTASDAQVPDDITVLFAQTAGDADTLDGFHANEIAESGSFSPFTTLPWYQPAAPFQFLRTGSRVRVTGVLNLTGFAVLPETFHLDGLPYRSSPFASATDAIGTATASLSFAGSPEPTDASLAADVGTPRVAVALIDLTFPLRDGGTIAVEFSYDVDP
jgi:hypothetical protein